MFEKISVIAFTLLLLAFPVAAVTCGYIVLDSHPQEFTANAYGWILFVGGFLSMVPAGKFIAALYPISKV